MAYRFFAFLASLMFVNAAYAGTFKEDREDITKIEGCYLVDYNYAETEALKEDYERDERRYDASAVEWIVLEEQEEDRLFFQRVMQVERESFETPYVFKHFGEEWVYEPEFVYEYQGRYEWSPRELTPEQRKGAWKRSVKALDDGPRYECIGKWEAPKAKGRANSRSWTCEAYSPIPGRETRDMNRDDYEGLERRSQIQTNDWGWKELQWNEKIVESRGFDALAKEVGNILYARLPEERCAFAQKYWQKRRAFWALSRTVWEEVLSGEDHFRSTPVVNGQPRYQAINQVGEEFSSGFVMKPHAHRDAYEGLEIDEAEHERIKSEILSTIEEYRR